MEDVGRAGDPFYCNRFDAGEKIGAIMEAKLLLPLKCMAYGVPPHCFRDYFEMPEWLARLCCVNFEIKIHSLSQHEYLRCPDSTDLKRVNATHRSIHGYDGMFGSIDCMHAY
jgi:hypothetical protein